MVAPADLLSVATAIFAACGMSRADAELLAEVYLAMTSGQGDLALATAVATTGLVRSPLTLATRPMLKVLLASAEETAAHVARLIAIDASSRGQCRWRMSTPCCCQPATQGA